MELSFPIRSRLALMLGWRSPKHNELCSRPGDDGIFKKNSNFIEYQPSCYSYKNAFQNLFLLYVEDQYSTCKWIKILFCLLTKYAKDITVYTDQVSSIVESKFHFGLTEKWKGLAGCQIVVKTTLS